MGLELLRLGLGQERWAGSHEPGPLHTEDPDPGLLGPHRINHVNGG